jgi:hypothetical protein
MPNEIELENLPQTIGNGGVVQIGNARSGKVFCGGAGGTHFVIDLTG